MSARGVMLRVPYRLSDQGLLQGFTAQRERGAFRHVANELAAALLNFARPGDKRSLRNVTVRSARIDAELKWSQRAKYSEGRTDRVEREIRIRQEGATKWDFPKTIREVEYTRNVPLTSEQRKRDLPAYFREGRNCIRLSISFQVSRNRLDLSAPGSFYYPLGAVRSRTGFPFSICAPFEMNEDRSQLVDPGNSDWNRWLVTECARVAIDLLKSEFFPNYGADAYRAFDVHSAAASTLPELVDHIAKA